MHHQNDSSKNDEIKTHFRTREGYYELMNSPDYSQRSQRPIGFSTSSASNNTVNSSSSDRTTIKISLVTVKSNATINPADHESFVTTSPHYLHAGYISSQSTNSTERSNFQQSHSSPLNTIEPNCDRHEEKKICFNVGRELFVYNYDGVRRGPDASRPIYKKAYKGSLPTCHDFNQTSACHESVLLLIGFTHGQVQLIDLMDHSESESSKVYNEDRLIDKTKVTCVKWLPGSSNFFLVAHASGQLYVYKADLSCGTTSPSYQIYRQSEGVTIFTCKTKTVRNPVYRWSIGHGGQPGFGCSLNEFAFSPCAKYLACVSQDGFLRVFCYDTMELIGRVRSYYGGLLCVCWSHDSKFVVTGGEDDLITIWSFLEKRVIARGQGHKSWINVVAFDPFCKSFEGQSDDSFQDNNSTDIDSDFDDRPHNGLTDSSRAQTVSPRATTNHSAGMGSQTANQASNKPHQVGALSSYRFGSVGQDTLLCFWDLSDDIINHPVAKSRTSALINSSTPLVRAASSSNPPSASKSSKASTTQSSLNTNHSQPSNDISNHRSNTLQNNNYPGQSVSGTRPSLFKSETASKSFNLGKKEKRQFSLTSRISDKHGITRLNQSKLSDDPVKLLGTPICPRIDEVPILEPTVCKKISYERLTSLIFCHDGFITSCQDGLVLSWSRPGRLKHKMYTGHTPGQSNDELHVIDVGATSIV